MYSSKQYKEAKSKLAEAFMFPCKYTKQQKQEWAKVVYLYENKKKR